MDNTEIILFLIKILKEKGEVPEEVTLEEWETVDLDPYFYRLCFTYFDKKYYCYARLNFEISTSYHPN